MLCCWNIVVLYIYLFSKLNHKNKVSNINHLSAESLYWKVWSESYKKGFPRIIPLFEMSNIDVL